MNLMMTGVRIALAFWIAMSAVPHAFCACHTRPVEKESTSGGCPHCRQQNSAPSGERPPSQPGQCCCDRADMALTAKTVDVGGEGAGHSFTSAPTIAVGRIIIPANSQGTHGAGPPDFLSIPVRALPILLGHLLF
ncbi:MAG: hypothetical protein HQ581_09765 [Planctomycetes bacterium]|nr:hypothetical protein [Planctomycetota bacterium]